MKITVIRTDGSEEEHVIISNDVFKKFDELINADCLDTVNLRDGRVMLVDDHGWESKMVDKGNGVFEMQTIKARKPVNEKATALYHAICVPGTTHQIVGDVIIAWDKDFE